MASLPNQYAFLDKAVKPPILKEALKYLGLREIAGQPSDPTIMGWAKMLKVGDVYKNDDMAWCALFVSACAFNVGLKPPKGYDCLRALKFAQWGEAVHGPLALGDIISVERFDRQGKLVGGHVGILVGEDDQAFHVLGGNQGDAVSFTRIGKQRRYTIRRTEGDYSLVHLPRLGANGPISAKED